MTAVIERVIILCVILWQLACAFQVYPVSVRILTPIGHRQRLKAACISYRSPQLSLQSISLNNVGEDYPVSPRTFFQRKFMDSFKPHIFPSVLFPALIASWFTPIPVLAAVASSALPKMDRAKVDSLRAARIRKLPKWARKVFRLARKLLFGSQSSTGQASVAANGSTIVWKSLARSMVIMLLFTVIAVTLLKWEDVYQTIRLKKEIGREMQYRESMFFDAVEDIIKKLEDPKVKSSMKDDLKKELRDLDPKGEIQAFLKGKRPRPDLSQRISESMKKKAAEKLKVEEAARVKMERLRQKEIQDGMARMRAEEDALEAERRRSKIQNDIRRKQDERNYPTNSSGRGPPNDYSVVKQVDFKNNNFNRENKSDVNEEEEDDDNYLEEDEEDEEDELHSEEEEEEDGSDYDLSIEDLQQPDLMKLGTQVFQKLNEELSAVLSAEDRRLLMQQLLNRVVSLSDAAHQKAALQNIGQRASNIDYWQAYLENSKT